MLSDELYDQCVPILRDDSLEDEDKTEKLEELFRKETTFAGKQLDNLVLDALWRYRSGNSGTSSPAPSRHTVIRRPSPAPWQIARTPTPSQNSPRMIRPPPGLTKSSTASPFTSPRASPRLTLSTPYIPHSPRLDAYQFSEYSPPNEAYGDLGSEAVEWLVNDDAANNAAGDPNGYPADWSAANAMDPYDLLRSILGADKTNDELEKALEDSNYDLTATIVAAMEGQAVEAISPAASVPEPEKSVLIGKSMSPAFRPATPAGQQKSHILCKYYLQSGHCARADCRFSHNPSKVLCKYWLAGSCLAGDSCQFSHDPSMLMARMMIDSGAGQQQSQMQPNFQLQDYDAFPALQAGLGGVPAFYPAGAEYAGFDQIYNVVAGAVNHSSGLNPLATYTPSGSSRPQSRPGSRQASRAATPSIPAANDEENFPSLGSAVAVKVGKKHHGKRGGHGHHKESPQSLADLVRMSPSPNPALFRKAPQKTRSFVASANSQNNAAARAIQPPEQVPWLSTGDTVNKAYVKARGEAFKHGGLRNKFLQGAAQAYNRRDSRAAKALSLRGQTENNLMREAHREAARILYEERNKENGVGDNELYVDLHGKWLERAA